MQWRKLVPSPAMVVALLALMVGLGGTSYAAAKIGSKDIKNDSILSKDIKNRTIKGKDVAPDTLKSWDIADGTIQAKDIRPGVIPGKTRWLLVNAAGQIEAQSGGFSVTAAYPALPSPGNGNVYINAGEDLTDNGLVATIALQNTVDLDGDTITNGRAPGADSNPEFSGEVSISKCGLPGTNCAPAGTGNTNHLVVSPRNSDGSFTEDGERKRFYVIVTGS